MFEAFRISCRICLDGLDFLPVFPPQHAFWIFSPPFLVVFTENRFFRLNLHFSEIIWCRYQLLFFPKFVIFWWFCSFVSIPTLHPSPSSQPAPAPPPPNSRPFPGKIVNFVAILQKPRHSIPLQSKYRTFRGYICQKSHF